MNQRLFFLRKLNNFNIDSKLLFLFYSSVIESVLLFCFCAWGGNCKATDLKCFNSVMKKCLKICNTNEISPNSLLETATIIKFHRIIKDQTHPLHPKIKFSKVRARRILSIKAKTERHKRSFLPRAIRSIWVLKHCLLLSFGCMTVMLGLSACLTGSVSVSISQRISVFPFCHCGVADVCKAMFLFWK